MPVRDFSITFKRVEYRDPPPGRPQYIGADPRFDRRDVTAEQELARYHMQARQPQDAVHMALTKLLRRKRHPVKLRHADEAEAHTSYRKRGSWRATFRTDRYFYDAFGGEFVPKETWVRRNRKRRAK